MPWHNGRFLRQLPHSAAIPVKDGGTRFAVGELVEIEQSPHVECALYGQHATVISSVTIPDRNHWAWVAVRLGDDRTLDVPSHCLVHLSRSKVMIEEAARKERQRSQQALAEQREHESLELANECQLVSVLLQKRDLVASSQLAIETSAQGLTPMVCPTQNEKAMIARVIYRTEEHWPIREEAWPSVQERALLSLAKEKVDASDPCAARLLAHLAVMTVDITSKSLAYQKPKLAANLRKIDELATRWLLRHAAYLPMVCNETRFPAGQPPHSSVANMSHVHACRLVLGMGCSVRLASHSPISLLGYDLLRRVGRRIGRAC